MTKSVPIKTVTMRVPENLHKQIATKAKKNKRTVIQTHIEIIKKGLKK